MCAFCSQEVGVGELFLGSSICQKLLHLFSAVTVHQSTLHPLLTHLKP